MRLLTRLLPVLAACASLHAQSPAATSWKAPADSAIREILKARVDSGRAAGIVVGVLENGTRRFVSYGSAGPGRKPLDEHTLFEIGSISKTFTATLLADMALRGEVRLDQPVAELLPAGTRVPERNGKKITLELLSAQSSGLPRMPTNFRPAKPDDPYADYDAEKMYAFLSGYELPRDPGASYEYSNLGVGLLGHALTLRARATSWGALVEQRVLRPLGMRESWVHVPPAAESRVSAGFSPMMDTVPAWHLDALAGAGALRSTAADMLTWLAAELDTAHGPLGRAMALTQVPRTAAGGGTRVGLGWHITPFGTGPVWLHDGGTGGFRTLVVFDPKRNVGVVVLANSAVAPTDIGLHLIAGTPLFMPPVPKRRTAVPVPAVELEKLVGRYVAESGAVMAITLDGDRLSGQLMAQPPIRLWPESPLEFFIREVDAQLSFAPGPDGRAATVTLHQNGRHLVFRRQ